MAFPMSAVLDDFTRADSADLGPTWTSRIRPVDTPLQISSNTAMKPAGPLGSSAAVWGQQMRYDCEAYATVSTYDTSVAGPQLGVYARVTNPGTNSICAYTVTVISTAAADTLIIGRLTNNVFTQSSLGVMAADLIPGDKIGIECIGETISAYTFQAGAWALRGSINERILGSPFPPGPGYIGVRLNDTTVGAAMAVDDFGGGPYTQPPAKPFQTVPTP